MSRFLIVMMLLLCSGCEKQARAPVGSGLKTLVTAKHAPEFKPPAGLWFEAVFKDGGWEYHDSKLGKIIVENPDQLEDAMLNFREQSEIEGHPAFGLISAPGETKFREISRMISKFAATGYDNVHLLVNIEDGVPPYRSLPVTMARFPMRFDPVMVQVDAQGGIFVGTGSARQLLDDVSAGSDTPGLEQFLQTYSAATKAADNQAICLVWTDEDAAYQRAVDVLSRMVRHDVRWHHHDAVTAEE